MLATTAITLALVGAGPNVDNAWFPLPVGRHWTYREGNVRTVVTATGQTRLMADGVVARVVHDESRERGVPVEITDDYYAQDAKGTVWYLGEATSPGDAPRASSSTTCSGGTPTSGKAPPSEARSSSKPAIGPA